MMKLHIHHGIATVGLAAVIMASLSACVVPPPRMGPPGPPVAPRAVPVPAPVVVLPPAIAPPHVHGPHWRDRPGPW
jgi:hypothetical protein